MSARILNPFDFWDTNQTNLNVFDNRRPLQWESDNSGHVFPRLEPFLIAVQNNVHKCETSCHFSSFMTTCALIKVILTQNCIFNLKPICQKKWVNTWVLSLSIDIKQNFIWISFDWQQILCHRIQFNIFFSDTIVTKTRWVASNWINIYEYLEECLLFRQ